MNTSLEIRPRARHRCAGFTLIELISIVAICGVLVALIVPALGKMRLTGLKAGTIGNMRQLGTASLAYAGEHGNRLPGPSSQGLYKGYTRNTTDQLAPLLAPYLGLPGQESLEAGRSVTVPQLVDPGYMSFNPKAPSSVPQFVQKIGYPAWMVAFAGRRPFGLLSTESGTPGQKQPFLLTEFNELRPEQRWLLTTVDQQVAGMTASWKSQTPKAPLYGIRFRLYADGRVAAVEANDPN